MTTEQAIKIIENEKKCVLSDCDDRSCLFCPLLKLKEKYMVAEAFDLAIAALNKRPYSKEEVREAVAAQIKGCL